MEVWTYSQTDNEIARTSQGRPFNKLHILAGNLGLYVQYQVKWTLHKLHINLVSNQGIYCPFYVVPLQEISKSNIIVEWR